MITCGEELIQHRPMSYVSKGYRMVLAQDQLRRWAEGELVPLDDFGGAATVLAEVEGLMADDPLSVVEILCEYWVDFREQPAAIDVLLRAVATEKIELADEIHDILLCSEIVLPEIAGRFVDVVRATAQRRSLIGDIATETWTRLALGNWCSSLEVRGHLQRAGSLGASAADATIYLVRAIAAGLTRWGDDDLAGALTRLGELDEFEADVAFELGMYHLRRACLATTANDGLRELQMSNEKLALAARWDGRIDAQAFGSAIAGLLRFAKGEAVTADDVSEIRIHINDYLLGYRGLNKHWRQGRADTSTGWALLLGLLADASNAVQGDWFDPSAAIEAAGALFVAESSIAVVIQCDSDGISVAQGIKVLVRPTLIDAFVSSPPSANYLDRWIDRERQKTHRDETLIHAVEQFREDIQRQTAPVAEVLQPLPLAEDELVRRTISSITEITPTKAVLPELTALTATLVRFTGYHLNIRQSGERKIGWLGLSKDDLDAGRFPKEHVLSDAIAQWIYASRLPVQIEQVNTGGGDADLVVRFAGFAFYIEVKRVLHKKSNEGLADEFGNQAVQYAATDIPIVFLAILDYAPRTVRIDLPGVIWTMPHQPDAASRTYSLTGIRIQARVESPSASSRGSGRRRPPTSTAASPMPAPHR